MGEQDESTTAKRNENIAKLFFFKIIKGILLAMKDILILYYTKNDSTKKMARAIARGVESVENVSSIIRTVDSEHIDEHDDLIVTKDDLKKCKGMIVGSPTHFGNMAAPLKAFFDNKTGYKV